MERTRDAEKMPEFSVRCVEIERVNDNKTVEATTISPQSGLAILGCLESLFLIAYAIVFRDGMAILAVLLLSSLSTLVGFGNKWTLRLHQRTQGKTAAVPSGDVVIRYPRGNFLIVQCTENVARELYFAPEAIDYYIKSAPVYRIISLVGTMMIMFGVICLANAQIQLQLAFGASYIFLNAAYWLVAALPSKMNWDTSCYRIAKQKFAYPDGYHETPKMHSKTFTDLNQTFTRALWKAIVATKHIGWVKHSNATPLSKAWDQWLRLALEQARTASWHMEEGVKVWDVPNWDPQRTLGDLLADPDYQDLPPSNKIEVEDAVAGSERC